MLRYYLYVRRREAAVTFVLQARGPDYAPPSILVTDRTVSCELILRNHVFDEPGHTCSYCMIWR